MPALGHAQFRLGWPTRVQIPVRTVVWSAFSFAVVTLVAIVPIWPLFTAASPAGYDVLPHLYRVAALDRSVQGGVLYPRWFDGFVFGYGYPVLYYYAPLFYYLAEAFRLGGLNLVASVNAAVIAIRLVGGFATYRLARSIAGLGSAGLIASVAFLLLPLQLADIFERSAYPEFLAFNLLPAAFWGVDQVVRRASARAIAGGALALAALVLAHQSTILVTGAALGIFAVGDALATSWDDVQRWRSALVTGARLALLGGLGIGLSAFFWWPAFVNRGWVDGLTAGSSDVSFFTSQLLPLADLFQPTFLYQQGFHGYTRLGPVEVGLAAIGLLVAASTPGRARPVLVLLGLLVVGFSLAMTTLVRPLWEAVPFVTLMQDPDRVETIVDVGIAVLIGGLARLRPGCLGSLVGVAAIILLAVSTLGAFRPTLEYQRPDAVNPASLARTEMFVKFPEIGTVWPVTQFLPRWVSADAATFDRSRARAQDAAVADVPARVRVTGAAPGQLWLTTSASQPLTFQLHTFYFPSWSGWLDGRPVEVQPIGERALLGVAIPAGEHALELDFGHDGALALGAILSLATLGAILALFVSQARPFGLLAGIVVGTAIGALLVSNRASAAPAGTVQPADLHFSDGLDLTGWSARPSTTSSGSALDVDLYWFARRDLTADDLVVLELVDSAGQARATYHRQPRWGSTPTSTWSAGELVRDEQVLALPGGLPAGPYSLAISLQATPAMPPSNVQTVGTVSLPATAIPTVAAPDHADRVEFADGLALAGFDVAGIGAGLHPTVQPGASVPVRLYWDTYDDPSDDYAVSVFLADSSGGKFAVEDSYPPHDLEFTAAWDKGSRHVQDYLLPVPSDLPTGLYSLAVEVYALGSGQRLPIVNGSAAAAATRATLLTLKRSVPVQPVVPARFEAAFGGQIALIGHDLALGAVDRAVHLTLRWQAIATPSQDYTVFVHLIDAQGRLIAQNDAQPRDGSYPTSTWDVGEVVEDEHTIVLGPSVQPGTYTVQVGVYQLSTGRRLPLASGGDTATIGTVEVR